MKFKINTDILKTALAKIQGLTGRRTNLAITEAVLIKAAGSGITLSASDLETGFQGAYDALIESEGSIAVNARRLFEITRFFPDNEISIHEIDNRLVRIGNDTLEYNIVISKADDFPDMPQLNDVQFLDINASGLKRITEQSIIITAGNNDKRAHICGCLFEILDNNIRIVSTDGSRLSTTDLTDVPGAVKQKGVIIPKKGLSEIVKAIGKAETVQVGIQDKHFILKNDAETIIIRLLEGSFPQYADIMEKKSDEKAIKIDRRIALNTLKRMSILSSDSYKGVVFRFEDNKLRITTTNPDVGESKEETEIDYNGEAFDVAFNPKYFIDTLNAINEDTVILNVIDERRPCLVEGENDKSYLTVIMPMRI